MVNSLRRIATNICKRSAVIITGVGAFVVNSGDEETAKDEFSKLVSAFKDCPELEYLDDVDGGALFRRVPRKFSSTYVRIIVAPLDKKLIFVEVTEGVRR